jgi:hypothetical protein
MIEISEQDYESVEEFKDGIINSFAEARGQPFGWGQFAFEALDNGERVGVVMGYWLYHLPRSCRLKALLWIPLGIRPQPTMRPGVT